MLKVKNPNTEIEFIIYNKDFSYIYKIYSKYNKDKITQILEGNELNITDFKNHLFYYIEKPKTTGKETAQIYDYDSTTSGNAQINFFNDEIENNSINKLIIDIIINLGIEDEMIADDNYFFNLGLFNDKYSEN